MKLPDPLGLLKVAPSPSLKTIYKQRARVEAFAAHLGLRVDWHDETLPCGFAYFNGSIAAKEDKLRPWMVLHDCAHYLIAPASRRRKVNFGLGAAPHVTERKRSDRIVTYENALREEHTAAWLGVVLARDLLGLRTMWSAAHDVSVGIDDCDMPISTEDEEESRCLALGLLTPFGYARSVRAFKAAERSRRAAQRVAA